MTRRRPKQADLDIQVATQGSVTAAEQRYALEKLESIVRLAHRPVQYAKVTLVEESNPATERPARAKANLDVSGRFVRAHVAAPRMREAIDLLERRLRRQLEQLADYRLRRRRQSGVAEEGEWRHGAVPTRRPDYYPRPPDERELVRNKSYAPIPMTPEEAALELELLDYDFFLFTSADTGGDSLLYRRTDGRLALLTDGEPGQAPIDQPEDRPPPAALSLDDAVERLNISGERFLFFIDADSGRGNVLYHRYDGHYGLIVPAEEEEAAAV